MKIRALLFALTILSLAGCDNEKYAKHDCDEACKPKTPTMEDQVKSLEDQVSLLDGLLSKVQSATGTMKSTDGSEVAWECVVKNQRYSGGLSMSSSGGTLGGTNYNCAYDSLVPIATVVRLLMEKEGVVLEQTPEIASKLQLAPKPKVISSINSELTKAQVQEFKLTGILKADPKKAFHAINPHN